MILDISTLKLGDICTIRANHPKGSAILQFENRKCQFIKTTRSGLIEVQIYDSNIRHSFARKLIHKYANIQTYKYYNIEIENEYDATEFDTEECDLDEIAIQATKLCVENEPEHATMPMAIGLIDPYGVKTIYEVNCDITYDYYASMVDY